MREWPYAKEPFDTKLFVLRFIKKIYWVLIGMLIGAFLIGGGYYLKKKVFGGPVEYEITTTYYLVYINKDSTTGQIHNYINEATWKEWVKYDWFVDRAWQFAMEIEDIGDKYNIKKEDLKTFFYGDMRADARMPISKVVTPYEELTIILNEALQKTYYVFVDENEEIGNIKIIDETPLQEADKDIRLVRAIILGAVVGIFISGCVVAFTLIWDDTIILPEIFAFRYHLPMVGYITGKQMEPDEKTMVNMQYLFSEKSDNILLTMGEIKKGEELLKHFKPQSFSKVLSVTELDAQGYEVLRQASGILFAVGAGEHHGKAIEHTLEELKLQNCKVTAAILYDADDTLIKCYRFGRTQK